MKKIKTWTLVTAVLLLNAAGWLLWLWDAAGHSTPLLVTIDMVFSAALALAVVIARRWMRRR